MNFWDNVRDIVRWLVILSCQRDGVVEVNRVRVEGGRDFWQVRWDDGSEWRVTNGTTRREVARNLMRELLAVIAEAAS